MAAVGSWQFQPSGGRYKNFGTNLEEPNKPSRCRAPPVASSANTHHVCPLPACLQLFCLLFVRRLVWITFHYLLSQFAAHLHTKHCVISSHCCSSAALCCLDSKVTYSLADSCLSHRQLPNGAASKAHTGWKCLPSVLAMLLPFKGTHRVEVPAVCSSNDPSLQRHTQSGSACRLF